MWKNKKEWIFVGVVYILFFFIIGMAIYITKSGAPLWALLLIPSFSVKNDDDDDSDIKIEDKKP